MKTKYRYYYCRTNGLVYRRNMSTDDGQFLYPHDGKWSLNSPHYMWKYDMDNISSQVVKFFEQDGGYLRSFRTRIN